MTDPFRDSEATAHARVEQLEAENQRLTEELEVARNQAGSNHQAYVQHLEDQLRDLKRDNAAVEARLAEQPSLRQLQRQALTPEMMKSQERTTYVVFGGMGFVAIAIALIIELLGK